MQGDKEFNVEVSTLSRLSHPSIVSLLGICVEGDQRIAVFELLPRGSLSAALCPAAGVPHAHKQAPPRGPGRPGQQRLPWSERVSIALDIARGLAYLHKVEFLICSNCSLPDWGHGTHVQAASCHDLLCWLCLGVTDA